MLRPIVDFDWFGLPIYFILLFIGFWMGFKELKKQQNGTIHGKLFLFISIALSFSVANFFSWFLHPGIFNIPMPMRIPFGGMFFYAGMLTFFGSSALLRFKSADKDKWLHEVVPAFIMFSIFERIGASLAGYSFGVETGISEGLFKLFPAREIEAIALVVMFFVFTYVIKKHRVSLYLLCYSILRFVLEFFRADDRGRLFITGLSPTQVLVIFTWVGLLAWIIIPKYFPTQYKRIYKFIFRKESVNKEPFVYTPRAPFNYLKGNLLRRIARFAVGILIVLVWLNPLNMNGIRDLHVRLGEFMTAFSSERSAVTVLTRDSNTKETRIRENIFIENIGDAVSLVQMHDEFGGDFIPVNFNQRNDGTFVIYFSQNHYGIPIYGAGKQLIIGIDGFAQKIVGMAQFGIEWIDFPDYILSSHEAKIIFESIFSDLIFNEYEIFPFWYYYPENINDSAYRLVYIFSLRFGDSFLDYVMDAETGRIIDVLAVNETSIPIHNRAITMVELKDSPAFLRGNIDQPEARDVIVVNFIDRIPQRYTFRSSSPIIVTVTNSFGDTRALLHVVGEQSIDLQPVYADEQYIIFIQSAGGVRHTLQQSTSLPVQPALLTASIFPFGNISTGRMVEDAIAAFEATYTVRVERLNGEDSVSTESRDIIREAVVHFNNSNGHAFLGLYRFDNIPLSDEIGAVLSELAGDDVGRLFSTLNPHSMALGLQAFLVSYRAFNTTIGIIANTTSDMAYRDRLLAAWSDNPDKTVMAMIFFLREIQNGQISPSVLMRLDDVTLNLFVLGELQETTHREVGIRAELTGSHNAVLNMTLVTQYFSAMGDVIPYNEIEQLDFWGNVLHWFTSRGERLVINLGRTIEIAQGHASPDDEDMQPFRSILPNWETEEARVKTILIPEGDNLNLYYTHGAVIESKGTVGIARVTIIVRETGYTVSWTPDNAPMSVRLNALIPSESLWRGNTYTIDIWASHSLDGGTGQRVGQLALVVRSRVDITSVEVFGSSVTIRGNYFMVGRVNVILDTWDNTNRRVVQSEFRIEEANYSINGEITTFSKTITGLPHGFYRPRVVGLELDGRQRRFERESVPFEIGFRPVWPTPEYGYRALTSSFGNRVHPVTRRVGTFHTGIDIGTRMGARVDAAASGTVAFAGWNGGYGNCIIIDHGNGYSTLYGHLNRIHVTRGQSVTQRQHIGDVGSTGVSTGPHLHFEILVRGVPVDPARYISGIAGIRIYNDTDTTEQPGNQNRQDHPDIFVRWRLLAEFSQAAYERANYEIGKEIRGWRVVHQRRPSDHLWYLILQNESTAIIVFRGTPPPSLATVHNWVRTIGHIRDGNHQQILDLPNEFTRSGGINDLIQRNNIQHIYITGHSLGGVFAVETYRILVESNRGHLVREVNTFNPVGVHPDTQTILRRFNAESKISYRYVCCDIAQTVSLAEFGDSLVFPGRERMIACPLNLCVARRRDGMATVTHRSIWAHSMERFFEDWAY